jgi:transposase
MERFGLRDDQWDRIKDILPGRDGHVGGTAADSRWAKSGVFARIFQLLASDADNEYMMIDATIVRAHQHSTGAQKKTATKLSADRVAD